MCNYIAQWLVCSGSDVIALRLPLDECGGLQLGVTSRQMRQGQVALVLSMIL